MDIVLGGSGGSGGYGQHGGGGADDAPSLEPPDVFCALGSLVVEGRIPDRGAGRGGGRGYHEGSHVELPGRISRHKCSIDEYLVSYFFKLWLLYLFTKTQAKTRLRDLFRSGKKFSYVFGSPVYYKYTVQCCTCVLIYV